MKYIKAYKLYESVNNEEVITDIVHIMSDIIDEHKNLVFKSPRGNMSYNDYLSKNDNYINFKPISKAGNKLKSKFTISFNKIENYDKLAWLVSEMSIVIDRLKQDGWLLIKMDIVNTNWEENKELYISNLDYHFSKSTQKINDDLPSAEEVADTFNSTVPGLRTKTNDVTIYDSFVEIEFDSIQYDGEIPNNVELYFDKMLDLLGFSEYEYDRRTPWGIKFWIN
jgi:hypothetical protein